jgi:glycosyltransferase involved in cell wall biosynthesis
MVTVDIVIPVYNEENELSKSVSALHEFLRQNMPSIAWRIVIVDNGSTDRTLYLARELAAHYPEVSYIHLDLKGRGRALRKAWLESTADIVSYMDVDLSTDLSYFPLLIGAIVHEGNDIAIGTRLSALSQTKRSFKREFLSKSYNLLLRAMFSVRFSDAQCGFKALSQRSARDLVPLIQDQFWFFDSELLILAEKKGYRIKEIPIKWEEDPDTRVNVPRTIVAFIKGLIRLRLTRPWT